MQILRAGVLYFALVFGAGFALGIVRTLWVVPRVGTRIAELMEAPIMLVVTVLAARWVVLRLAIPSLPSARLGVGAIALGFLLVAEFGLVPWLRGIPVKEYLARRDLCPARLLRDARVVRHHAALSSLPMRPLSQKPTSSTVMYITT